MTRRRAPLAVPLAALFAAFAAGALCDWWLRAYGPPLPAKVAEVRPKTDATKGADARVKPDPAPGKDPTASKKPDATIEADYRAVATTGAGPLRLPLDGVDIEGLKGGFAERRGGGRPHEAVDILAPRNTPVYAVENGTIAKLFVSKQGGITIYQYDPSGRLCYYYAHLERYADGLREGQTVSRGDVLGYVGTSGNAPANTPHLHFAVFELDGSRKWWHGHAIDPYLVFSQRAKG